MGPLHVDKSTFRWIAISLAAVASLALVALGVQIGSGILGVGGQQAPTNAAQRSAAVVDASEAAPQPAPAGAAATAETGDPTVGFGVVAPPAAPGAPAGDEGTTGGPAEPPGDDGTPAPPPAPPGPVPPPPPPPSGPSLDPVLAPLAPVLEPLPLGGSGTTDAPAAETDPGLVGALVAILGL